MEKSKFLLDFEKPLRAYEERLAELNRSSREQGFDVSDEVEAIQKKLEVTRRSIFSNLSPWQKIQLARHPQRPYAPDYVKSVFDDFQELHGDRNYGDDQALTGGYAFFGGKPVMVLSQQKGRDTRENLRRNFGMPNPEGYRKALRLMRLADKFNLPIIAFIDTPGAYPGLGSEERHVAEAIAINLREMSRLGVPIISVVLGEGGSGGALGIGVANRVLVLEYAYYSVISPEGCAAILWKDRAHAAKAAAALRVGAQDLREFGVADEVIKEPFGGAHSDPAETSDRLKKAIGKHLNELLRLDRRQLRDNRYDKFRRLGRFEELQKTNGGNGEGSVLEIIPAEDSGKGEKVGGASGGGEAKAKASEASKQRPVEERMPEPEETASKEAKDKEA